MRILLTGAAGFLGWHTRCLLFGSGHQVVPVQRDNWSELPQLLVGCDAVIHVAGVNRGDPEEVAAGNQRLALELVDAMRTSGCKARIVYAGSTQQDQGTSYGRGKAEAAKLLAERTRATGAEFVEVVLPNLFGEHGRADYNSFVATFVERLVTAGQPVISDRQVELLHVQSAAQALVDGLEGSARVERPRGADVGVAQVWHLLEEQYATYSQGGEIPDLSTPLSQQLFNQLRARMFVERGPIALAPRNDARGSLVETVRACGGQGQTFFSTTLPGITRGEHFHRRKLERFVVVSGQARIRLRRLFSEQVVTFDVDGAHPVAIDMPTMWVHNITNTGDAELVTMFWTNELFNPEDPDTISASVEDLSSPEEFPCH